jgi:hypothetical protein
LRPQQPEEAHAEARRGTGPRLEALERRGCERELGNLAQPQALLRRSERDADARLPGTKRLDVAQDSEEVVLVLRSGDPL